MAEKHPTVVGTFYKVGNVYYYDRCWHGRRIRITTKQTSLDAAAEWVRTTPFGSRIKRVPVAPTRVFFNRAFDRAKHNAKARGIPFEITRDDVDTLWAKAAGFCQVSGLPFDMREVEESNRRPYAPSIDRVDGLLGYTLGNCRMVCAAVNLAMNEFGEKVLWDIASSMVLLRSKHSTLVKNSA